MKQLIFTFLALFIVISVQAQLQLGVKAGANFATLHADGISNVDTRIGYHLGAFGNYALSENIGIQAELLFSSEGMEYELVNDGEGTWVLNYLQVPLLLRFQPFGRFNIHAGPQFGFKLSGKDKFEDYEDDITELEGFTFGFAGGAGYGITDQLELGARYTATISDIVEESTEVDITSRVFQVFLAYRLK